jgi:hypothetical protein
VTKELYSVPVQTGLERFEGGLVAVRVSMQGLQQGGKYTVCISRTSS